MSRSPRPTADPCDCTFSTRAHDAHVRIIPGHGQLSTRTDLLEYRSMLVTIRDRILAQIAQGLSEDEVVAANPTEGFAQPGAGTERWVRAAYVDLR